MTIATKKEQLIAQAILNKNFPTERFNKISQMLFRRMSKRQESIRLIEKNKKEEKIKRNMIRIENEYRLMNNKST